MKVFRDWLEKTPHKTAPLFATDGLEVQTFDKVYKRNGTVMRKLKRNEAFDKLLIEIVEEGFKRDDWEGYIYLMHFQISNLQPLYVGKAERRGVSSAISFNLRRIRSNDHAFGRWGYGLAYHIGDLSHAVFREKAYKKPAKKYERWADTILQKLHPPTLKETVYVSMFSWYRGARGPSGLIGSVPSVEKELIAILGSANNKLFLNKDGR